MGADIAFEDEAGIGIRTRSGRTWGEVNQTPVVTVNQERGGYNVLSAITAAGELAFDIEEKSIDGKRYIEFLEKLLAGRTRPLIVIADNATSEDTVIKSVCSFFLPMLPNSTLMNKSGMKSNIAT